MRSVSALGIFCLLAALTGIVPASRAAEVATLPEWFTLVYADCERGEFLRAASGFPLDSEDLAAIELAARFVKQGTAEEKRGICQTALLMIERQRAFAVLTWRTPDVQLEWNNFILRVLKSQQTATKDAISETDKMQYCPNAGADGKVVIRGEVVDCGCSPTSNENLWCSNWHIYGFRRRLAQLMAVQAPESVLGPMRRANEADLKCYRSAFPDGGGGWTPAYECPEADKLGPKAEAVYKAYIATHHPPWKSQKEECAALKPF